MKPREGNLICVMCTFMNLDHFHGQLLYPHVTLYKTDKSMHLEELENNVHAVANAPNQAV